MRPMTPIIDNKPCTAIIILELYEKENCDLWSIINYIQHNKEVRQMTNFANNLKAVSDSINNRAFTENGAAAYKTTGRSLLDLNFSIPAMRKMTDDEIIKKWSIAYDETPELAMRWLFFLRDPRGGMGERRAFRVILKWMAMYYPELISKLVRVRIRNNETETIEELIPFYGRWDDLMELTDSSVEFSYKVYKAINDQFKDDLANMHKGYRVSLLAKWLPSLSNKNQKAAARKMAKKLGLLETPYRKLVAQLRRYIDVTEVKMSNGQWGEIKYPNVPGRAGMIYRNAFMKHDEERYTQFIEDVNSGKEKMNAATLFPHEIVSKIRRAGYREDVSSLEAMWKSLPNLIPAGTGGTLVVRDGSGSMETGVGKDSKVSAADVADALSLYFAEKLSGEFHNKLVSFSEHPVFIDLDNARSQSVADRMNYMSRFHEVANTNIEAVFNMVLDTAVRFHMKQESLPANILIISDMEFDICVCDDEGWRLSHRSDSTTLFDNIKQHYSNLGYKLPKVIFWNVNSRSGAIPMTENELGVTLVSGFSLNLVKMVMSNKMDPWDCLVEQLLNPRYNHVSDALDHNNALYQLRLIHGM